LLRGEGIIWRNVLVWWHDSYFEREKFASPNPVIKKYLKYLPGTYIDGIAFINNGQIDIARRLFTQYKPEKLDTFFKERAIVVPNTSDVPWEWKDRDWESEQIVFPPQDNYNDSFFRDIGLLDAVENLGYTMDDTVLLLQHTRVVPRKKIETAIDLAFKLEEKYKEKGLNKCIALIVSGHSGDEQEEYKKFLNDYIVLKANEFKRSNVIMIFGEHCILSHRDIIVDKKYYKFSEVPSIISAYGGLGTYFSEVEGYGNNLLEMMCLGLPVVINKYEVYKSDIEHLNFKLPAVEDCILTDSLVEDAFELINNIKKRNEVVRHNLQILEEKLSHAILSEKLKPLITKMFYKTF
jgi:glycosyltransferase involved in cell wall biosynthesis